MYSWNGWCKEILVRKIENMYFVTRWREFCKICLFLVRNCNWALSVHTRFIVCWKSYQSSNLVALAECNVFRPEERPHAGQRRLIRGRIYGEWRYWFQFWGQVVFRWCTFFSEAILTVERRWLYSRYLSRCLFSILWNKGHWAVRDRQEGVCIWF